MFKAETEIETAVFRNHVETSWHTKWACIATIFPIVSLTWTLNEIIKGCEIVHSNITFTTYSYLACTDFEVIYIGGVCFQF